MSIWTFEKLAQLDRQTLEDVFLTAQTPDLAQLNGHVYDGYNHERMGQLPGEKFRKAFYRQDDTQYGYNQIVMQDGRHYLGAWQTRMDKGKPARRGYYRVTLVSDEPSQPRTAPYRHLALLNYNIALNPRWAFPIRSIRDYVGAPNAGDHSLLLGKAYLQIAPGITFFASYFILGHPHTLDEE
jgi:hypothetical protein